MKVSRLVPVFQTDVRPPPFSPAEYATRLQLAQQSMEQQGIDVMYLTGPDSMFYLHGYEARWYRAHCSTSWPTLTGTAIHHHEPKLIHFDEEEEGGLVGQTSVVSDVRLFPEDIASVGGSVDVGKLAAFVCGELKKEGWLGGKVGMEMWSHVPNPAVARAFEDELRRSHCEVVDCTKVLRSIRRKKSKAEIEYIEKATKVADIGISAAMAALHPGVTELDVYGEMVRAMARAGGENSGIQGLIAFGSRANHAMPSNRALNANEHVFLDPCGVVSRYHANVGRGVWVGDVKNRAKDVRTLSEMYRKAAGGLKVFCASCKPGKRIAEVHEEVRRHYIKEGIWEQRVYVGGYELGVSFPPDWCGEWVYSVDEDPEGCYEIGMVFNFEAIFAAEPATAIIDTIVVGEDGARALSEIPPELELVDVAQGCS